MSQTPPSEPGSAAGPTAGPTLGTTAGPAVGPQVPLPTNGKATAALVAGVTALVFSWCCGLGLAGLVAVVLGLNARTEIRARGGEQPGAGLALAGILTGALAAVLGVVVLVVIAVAVFGGGWGGGSD